MHGTWNACVAAGVALATAVSLGCERRTAVGKRTDVPVSAPSPKTPRPTAPTASSSRSALRRTLPVRAAPSSSALPSPRPDVGKLVRVPIPDDRTAVVVAGASGTERVGVYLHGVCGNLFAIEDWALSASRYITTVALFGDRECADRTRFKWTAGADAVHSRIQAALAQVKSQLPGPLDIRKVIIMGYSQGALWAQGLAHRYPDRYPWVWLGGVPTTPSITKLGRASRVAVVGGAREDTSHMQAGVKALAEAKVAARFFRLPGAAHGQYGAGSPEVVANTLQFLLSPAPAAASAPAE